MRQERGLVQHPQLGWYNDVLFRCKSKCSKCIHDKVNIQELDGLERWFSSKYCSDETCYNSNNVDSQLELNKLLNTFKNITTPQGSWRTRKEVRKRHMTIIPACPRTFDN